MRRLALAAMALCLLLPLGAQTVLKMATWSDPKDPIYVPIIAFATAVYKDAGYELEVDFKPAERAIRDANEGIDDGDLSRVKGIEASYPNLVMIPEPFVTLNQVAYSTKPFEAKSIDDLGKLGLNVVVVIGNKIMDSLVKPKIAPEKYIETADLSSALRLLLSGRVDVLLMADLQIQSALEQPQNATIRPLFTWMSISTFSYLNKKWAEAVPKIAASYKKLRK